LNVTDADLSPHLSVKSKNPVVLFSHNLKLLYNICIDKVKHNLENKFRVCLTFPRFVLFF